jgi:hypothetical protein
MNGTIPPLPQYVSWSGAQLKVKACNPSKKKKKELPTEGKVVPVLI